MPSFCAFTPECIEFVLSFLKPQSLISISTPTERLCFAIFHWLFGQCVLTQSAVLLWVVRDY